ncbi:ephexin-1 [Limosa lapponica baueri]|uniref:Ephexin-1 n=1 Tax=Limosa lapponica baueri TaxID=1758121 RepID=A0A2I0SZM4_LIMLA|nr:ephexin-1 [Limosa lapponica baueri]
MKRWMISLAPNRRTKFVSFTSRLVDCPQIQCVHPYVAQQPDELSLELADVLNILDKTDDGTGDGLRLGGSPCVRVGSTVGRWLSSRQEGPPARRNPGISITAESAIASS